MSRDLSKLPTDEYHKATIVEHGEKIVLPEDMDIDVAIDLLIRRRDDLAQEVSISRTFDCLPWDGAYCLSRVFTEVYGWVPSQSQRSMFGSSPPQVIDVQCGPKPTDFVSVPWGQFGIPGVPTGKIECSSNFKNGMLCFSLVVKTTKKYKKTIQELFDKVTKKIQSDSIYRGKALKISFIDDNGKDRSYPVIKFIDTNSINPDLLCYNEDVNHAIETNLFTPIRRVTDCLRNGISLKRGVLLAGTFGTGKTIAANVASKYAQDNGITYIYIPRAAELPRAINFAKNYQSPACVIFCEDIDRVTSGSRSTQMDDILNIVDGIDSKNSNIIVVLTTNDLESINKAMLRPGRLDAVINVTPPDANTIQRLIRTYAGNTLDHKQDLTKVGELLAGQIPAVVAEVVTRAKLAQVSLQEPGTIVTKITAKALEISALSIKTQTDMLNAPVDNKSTTVEELIGQEVERRLVALDAI